MICGIYEIYCSSNNKRYVGQAENIDERWINHIWKLRQNKHHNKHLQNAFNKYGENCFIFRTVELCNVELLDEREIFYIKELNAHETLGGFNVCWGGSSGMRGVEFSEEHRRRLSESHLGKKASDEARKKMSESRKGEKNSFFGKKHSEESRKKIGDSERGEKSQFFGKFGKDSPRFGIPHLEETKKKMSEAQSGEKNGFFGKKHSDETLKKMKENHKDYNRENHPRFGTKTKNATSKFFGVYKYICNNGKYVRWIAAIRMYGKVNRVGTFKTEIEAAYAYNCYVIKNKLPHPLNDISTEAYGL
jgi:group I intron endonuclease